MALWDKVKQELDRAGKVAQEAIDEGRIRLEQVRARQLADKAAQRLGYAYSRARTEGLPTEDDAEITRLHATLVEHEAEATRLETELDVITRRTRPADATADAAAAAGATAAGTPPTTGEGATDFGGNSGESHRPDGTVDTGGAAAAGGPTSHAGGAADTFDAPGGRPSERDEWNREHL